MIETGLVPVFYHKDINMATRITQACLDGGARCIEFTNRGDQAHEVFAALIRHFQDDGRAILGAGSVLDAPTAALYIQSGANFIVGPNLNPEVAYLCNRRKIPYSPGCGSVSEISQAEELGVEICKVFPAGEVGGPAFVKAILAPLPWSRLMPTGGVEASQAGLRAWFDAGVACVGMGSNLITKDALAANDFERITQNVRQALEWIRVARQGKPPLDWLA
jgi:2-dehydro-3-deoxyphosphogluconate aldolase/(4S)-4-hydroxy-2-oxoglutarate aldolase